MDKTKICTCISPVNIAVIKYWGKRDEQLILPTNSSLSVTLGLEELQAKTTVAFSKTFIADRIWLNGREQSVSNPRIQNVLNEIRRRAESQGSGDINNLKVHICSENNFPTAAGLASSAAGYACLVYSLAQLYGVTGELSDIARLGSGSACRSLYGGFVLWEMGTLPDGSDSLAKQIASEDHWPGLHILILVVNDQKKQVGSTEGMQTTVETSELMKHRAEIVQSRITEMKDAIQKQDFQKFARLTMQESNQLHAVCLDTYPPLFYMNDTSRQIIQLIHAYNKLSQQIKVAYTFDAGPNACLYLLEENVVEVVALLNHFFSRTADVEQPYVRGIPVQSSQISLEVLNQLNFPRNEGAVRYVIHTKIGAGPKRLEGEDHSLLNEDGLPKIILS